MALIGTAVLLVGFAYLVVMSLLPIMSAQRANPYAAHTGGGGSAAEVAATNFTGPAEAILPRLFPGPLATVRRKIDVGYDFNWGSYLERQIATAIIGLGVGLLVFNNVFVAVGLLVLVPIINYVLARRRARAFEAKFLLQLPNALMLVSSAMAAGRNFVNALQATTPNLADPIKTELIALANRISALRVTEAQAFEMWAEKLPYPELHTISSALAIGNQIGLETYSLLRSLSSSIQDEIKARNELEALTSQVRSTATVISYLPIIFILLIYFILPKFVIPLFTTIAGWIVIVLAGGMNWFSRFWTRRILARIEA